MYVLYIYAIYTRHIHKSPRFIPRFVPVTSPFPAATPAARPCHLRNTIASHGVTGYTEFHGKKW